MRTLCLAIALFSCTSRTDSVKDRALKNEILIVLESPPATLEPRQALDAQGQRLNMLMFRALTSLDHELVIRPDLATKWWTEKAGKRWVFQIAQEGPSAAQVAVCISQYLTSEKASPLKGSFPSFRGVGHEGNRLWVDLHEPDPFFPRNASLFRYYTEQGVPEPCSAIQNEERVLASGSYEMRPFRKNPEETVLLHAKDTDAPSLRFQFVRDETARLQKLLTGEVDAAPNSFSASRWQWLKQKKKNEFQFLMRDGVNVSYLAFQFKDPALSKAHVRQAIAHAIDIRLITQHKFPENTYPAGSFLSERLPGSVQNYRSYSPETSEALLDKAGYPRGKDGVRLRFKYKTTPSKDGFDTALILKEMLGKVGIALELDVVEPGVFFASIRKGHFQMYSSRWVGISDASIFYRTLSSKSKDNRLKYEDAEMNLWLDELKNELEDSRRNAVVKKVQQKMAEDVPYFPLWFWTNSLILRPELTGLLAQDLSLSGSYVPLQKLRWKK